MVGQNLLQQSHPEFETAQNRSEIQRGVYATLTVRFQGNKTDGLFCS